jgi:S-adenosylmethionine:tRNA ribosyltransferase-isomerase
MKSPFHIQIEQFNYELPQERIAKYPLPGRDTSRLLLYRSGHLESRKFTEIASLLPDNSLLVFNETKVIQARLLFQKKTGARIEVFCLEPVEPVHDFQLAFQQGSPVVWKCLVGNAKRWKSGILEMETMVDGKPMVLKAEKVEKHQEASLVRFSWEPSGISFSEIIERSGLTPLPPYLHREAEEEDKIRYQTIYARHDGSVAAPTAGLHFTDRIMRQLADNRILTTKVTLHVGAGTFRPVITDSIADHEMHGERIVVSKATLETLLEHVRGPVIPVGTTSMRTLESLYWMALKIRKREPVLKVEQWDPYLQQIPEGFTMKDALVLLLEHLEKSGNESLTGETHLMIAPGYEFRICRGIVTNFHQPKSTLLLLVAALVGEDWKKAYDFALENDFRFLSYGDSCLFLP